MIPGLKTAMFSRRFQQLQLYAALFFTIGIVSASWAAMPPFSEDFDTDHSNWLNFNGSAPLAFNLTNGPDGGSYVSGPFNFKDSVFGSQEGAVIFRGNTNPLGQSSDGAFFGDWLADGVGGFTAQVRHNATVPLTFFTRFADVPFPGATAIQFIPVFPNTWTEFSVEIAEGNPQFVTFENSTFAGVFDGIGRLQIGVSIPAAFAGVDQEFTFDLDKVSITAIPEPASWLLLSISLMMWPRHKTFS